ASMQSIISQQSFYAALGAVAMAATSVGPESGEYGSGGTTSDGLKKNLIERALSVVSDVRAGEGAGAILLTTDLFLLLGAYYLLKVVRESVILAEGGAEVKAYSSAAQALILLGVIPFYGWIATHLNRNRLLRWTTLFFALNLIVFYFVGRTGTKIGV